MLIIPAGLAPSVMIEELPHDWLSRLDELALTILRDAGISTPPIDAFLLAERLGSTVIIDDQQSSRGRTKRMMGQATILLRSDDRPERMQWAAAHEVAETQLWRWAETLAINPRTLPEQQREQWANRLASRLLLPRSWFQRDSRDCDNDLLELKRIYATASHELIAQRWLDLPELAVVTIFDQNRLTRRLANGMQALPRLLPWEQDCWQAVRSTAQPQLREHAAGRVRGWPIYQPDWRREILCCTFTGDAEALTLDEFNEEM